MNIFSKGMDLNLYPSAPNPVICIPCTITQKYWTNMITYNNVQH